MSVFKSVWNQIKGIANISEHVDTTAAERSIRSNIVFKGPNIWILAFSIIIASVGLNVNSTPVIIGAMLISPLMGPIIGLGLGLGINDLSLLKDSAKNLLVMVSISLLASLLYFLITPLSLSNPTELLARTLPLWHFSLSIQPHLTSSSEFFQESQNHIVNLLDHSLLYRS